MDIKLFNKKKKNTPLGNTILTFLVMITVQNIKIYNPKYNLTHC